jgi:hypothetical protein
MRPTLALSAHFLSFLKPGLAFLFFPFFPLGPAQVWSFSLHAQPDKPMPPPQHDGLTRLINPARQGSQPGRAAARHLPFIVVPSLRPHRIAGATPEPSACARAMTLPDSSRIDIRIVIEPRFSPFWTKHKISVKGIKTSRILIEDSLHLTSRSSPIKT